MTSTQLHPLCIINMSDHYTRLSLNSADGASAPTYGILYGSPPTPTTTELLDSDDLPFTSNGSVITIDTAKLDLVKSLHTEVFPTHSVQGLYKVGPAPTPHDMSLLSSLQLNTPTPLLFVRLNPTISADELPIEVYTVASPAGNNVFLLADFTIETEEAEAVAITNVVKQRQNDGDSKTISHLSSLKESTESLSSRITTLIEYLDGVQSGKVQPDYALLRNIQTCLDQIPSAPSTLTQAGEAQDYEEALAMTYLAVLAKTGFGMKEVSEKWAGSDSKIGA